MKVKIFLAGIIQGSQIGTVIHDQEYRGRLRSLLKAALPEAEAYCPHENHPNSLSYDQQRASEVFFEHVAMASEADVVIAYVPQASMGTAIEMWEAYRAGRIVLTISPLTENWVIRLLSTRNFTDMKEFEAFVSGGEFASFLEEHARPRR
ncbi:MAG: hypothetical protein GXY33_18885 [Phycisphaerae bacterium]|nr:hypothetical protein [Phycisphaerae bacterium]